MATHQQYKNFVKKYNSEFGFRGYTKLKKQELINKIESVLDKSRKEIKDEYKKLKEMKKEAKPKPAKETDLFAFLDDKPKKKPAAKKTPAPKPVAKKTPAAKPKPVAKKTRSKKPEYKLTKQDIERLKDWAELRKRKYSSMDMVYKKEILFDLKRNDIFLKMQPKTRQEYDSFYEKEEKLFDTIYPNEELLPEEKLKKRKTPAPKKKEPKKKVVPKKPAPKKN